MTRKFISDRMAIGKDISGGSMPVEVVFFTREALSEAQEWVKGKKGYKFVTAIYDEGSIPFGADAQELPKDHPRRKARKAPADQHSGKSRESPESNESIDDLV